MIWKLTISLCCLTGNVITGDIVENSVDSVDSFEIPIIPDLTQFLKADLKYNESHLESRSVLGGSDDIKNDSDNESDCTFDEFEDSDYEPSESDEPSLSDDSGSESGEDDGIPLSPVTGSVAVPSRDPNSHCSNSLSVEFSSTNMVQLDNVSEDDTVEMTVGCADVADMVTTDVEDANSELKITVMTTNNIGGRKYDKRAFCFFCGAPQSKLPRHLSLKHGTETMVVEWINEIDKGKKCRQLLKIRNLGNHKHNKQVLEKGEGEFIVLHRPKDLADHRDYVPCRFCYGYLAKQAIWKHGCPLAPKAGDGTKLSRLRKAGSSLAKVVPVKTTTAFAGLLNGMRQDEIGHLASNDLLILQLGQRLCSKFSGNLEQFHYIRSKMRHVAKLLMVLRKTSAEMNTCISDFIVPTKFRAVVAAAQECAGLNATSSEYEAPSAAMKSGGVLRRLAEIKQSNALERGDAETAELCCQFLKLCDVNWSTEVSSVASRNITERKRNGVLYMPLTEDVMKLNGYLVSEAQRLSLLATSSSESYATLAQVVLAKVIVFNRKRQGEVSKVTVQDYMKKSKADNTDIGLALTDFERALLKTLERMEIRGKRERTVPILLTEEMISWIDKLLEARASFVPASNKYLFASCGEQSHFRGSDALRKFALLSQAKRPHLLTSTKLRKNVASMAQVLSLKHHELDSLATFMGHDIRVHAEFYRMPLDVVQIARISKIFLAAEQGKISQFAGKELADISIDPCEAVEESSDADESSDKEDTGENECDASERPESEQDFQPNLMKRSRTMTNRKRWSEAEKDAVRSHFASDILQQKLPGKSAIEEFLKKTGINRPWTKVKDHIRNTYLH